MPKQSSSLSVTIPLNIANFFKYKESKSIRSPLCVLNSCKIRVQLLATLFADSLFFLP